MGKARRNVVPDSGNKATSLLRCENLGLFSYVVRYDSGFAPNPFFGYCTLATCKPDIRRSAEHGEWIIGTGSADKSVQRGGCLVYAMRVTDILTFEEYWTDARFQRKKPDLRRSKERACGDNIYYRDEDNAWQQLDSFHSNKDGSISHPHVQIDTKVNRVLISDDFIYFGGHGPRMPDRFRTYDDLDICKIGRGQKKIIHTKMVMDFANWIHAFGDRGYVARPYDWTKMP